MVALQAYNIRYQRRGVTLAPRKHYTPLIHLPVPVRPGLPEAEVVRGSQINTVYQQCPGHAPLHRTPPWPILPP